MIEIYIIFQKVDNILLDYQRFLPLPGKTAGSQEIHLPGNGSGRIADNVGLIGPSLSVHVFGLCRVSHPEAKLSRLPGL